MDIVNDLKSLLKGDVDASEDTLNTFSRDASLFVVKPTVVVFPRDAKDVEQLVQYVNEQRAAGNDISLTGRSGGTDMTGGPLTTSIVVAFDRYFNNIQEIGEDYAITQPGVYYRDFEKATLEHDLLLPCYTASKDICTVGGMVCNNSGGEKTLRYGKTEQFVESVKMVLSDGKEHEFHKLSAEELELKKREQSLEGDIYRKLDTLIANNHDLLQQAKPQVTKNSSGYYLWNVRDPKDGSFDITKLLVGSQGTFGMLTEVKFRLVKPDPESSLVTMFLTDIDRLGEITDEILKYDPVSLESYDDNTFKLAAKLFPAIAKHMKGNIVKLGLDFLPEFKMILTGGVPKLVLLIEFTGVSREHVIEQAQQAAADLRKLYPYKVNVITEKEREQKYWVMRRESFSLLRKHVRHMRTAPFIDDFAVQPKYLPEFLPKLHTILAQYPLFYTIAGHVGDGNFHIIPLIDPNSLLTIDEIQILSKEVYALVLEYHGTITAEHNDGLIRSPFLEQAYGKEVCALFEEAKNIFDPQNIFNPGKKVYSDWQYALDHLDVKHAG